MRMRLSAAAAVLAASSPLVNAFAGTYPILAWSSHPLSALEQLSPTHVSQQSVFRPTSQTPFVPSPDSDLCSLNSILLVSVPGLHASDFSLLPERSSGIRASLRELEETVQVLTVPYVEERRTRWNPAERLAKTFVAECGAVVRAEGFANFWAGEKEKEVRVEVVEGLKEWKLVGKRVKEKRRKIVENIDEVVQAHLVTLQAPYLVILTTLPPTSTAALVPAKAAIRKRQIASPTAKEFPGVDSIRIIAAMQEGDGNDDDNGDGEEEPRPTSIFTVDPNSGLLHRYVFFTPSLIFCLLVTLLLFIPVVLISSMALTTTHTLAGFETKMTGSVGIDPAKS